MFLAVSVATAFATLFTANASASTNYVALGDSYSSGVGAGSYISSSGSCLRSTNAYSQLWANANHPSSYVSVACSGAQTSDVINSQVKALSTSTSLVSITIGGNDVGFASVMQTCILNSTATCLAAVSNAESQARSVLPGRLANTFAAIRAHAPNAHVVVLDYPEFYDLNNSWICPGLSGSDRSALNGASDVLASVIQSATQSAGFTFSDVRGKFQGHELCDPLNEWLHAVDVTDLTESYHPNASGHSGGYLPAFSAKA